jgi:CheY-like chemotaxis protein
MADVGTPILIIEDDRAVAESLRIRLAGEGFTVAWKLTGQEGMAYAQKNSPYLVILDIRLPDGSGFDFCRQMRQMGLHQPIIMLTARREEMDKVLGLEMGADDYVTKPFGLRVSPGESGLNSSLPASIPDAQSNALGSSKASITCKFSLWPQTFMAILLSQPSGSSTRTSRDSLSRLMRRSCTAQSTACSRRSSIAFRWRSFPALIRAPKKITAPIVAASVPTPSPRSRLLPGCTPGGCRVPCIFRNLLYLVLFSC